MEFDEIEFVTQEKLMDSQRSHLSPSTKNLLQRLRHFGFDFSTYRELFEREVLESMIRVGEFSRLEFLPVDIGDHLRTQAAAQILGVNLHSERRRKTLADLYSRYDNATDKDEFFRRREYLDTHYFKMETLGYSRTGWRALTPFSQKSHLEKVARSRIRMLLNYREAEGITGCALSESPSKRLSCVDLPWAIDYMGTIKLRDGAHRRSTLEYLGHTNVPTIVVSVKDLSVRNLQGYLSPDTTILSQQFSEFERILGFLVSQKC